MKNQWVYKVAYTWSTVVKAAGTKVAYDHEDYLWKDKVEIPGPTKQVLKLMVRRHQLCVLYKTLQMQKRAHACMIEVLHVIFKREGMGTKT